MSKFSVHYFIDKFRAIPEEKWCVDEYGINGRHCALGHCGYFVPAGSRFEVSTPEGSALIELLGDLGGITEINDGDCDAYPQPTPKQRILAALQDIENMELQS